ncbi:DUF3892 domain-containing protein [Chryseobacterium sp. MYb328]|uniref:DUF3892 domain-containing protein n=1 Tax=Chryseobacterium sp. MYb328 TaxID=2745231 RepID=UPI0030B7009A
MNKRDYFISGIWKDSKDRITHVLLHKVMENGSFNPGIKTTEQNAIKHIKNGKKIYTLNWGYPGWNIGAEVTYVLNNNNEYLRTIHNSKTEDNLDNLISMKSIHYGQK